MNCIWILLLLCLCNGNGSWGGCSDREMDCGNSGSNRRNDREDRDDDRNCGNNSSRRGDMDCNCDQAGRDTCSRDRDDRRDDRWDNGREDRRFPMPPFAPETGRCCEASEGSFVMENPVEE